MAKLLIQLRGNKSLNRTIFPPHLYIYEDLLIYKKGHLFGSKESTISYGQISQIILSKGIFFANIQIVTTGNDDIVVNWVNKKLASTAKKIIDQKIYQSHSKHSDAAEKVGETHINVEKALSRLKELVVKGHLSEKEYQKKKNDLLKSV